MQVQKNRNVSIQLFVSVHFISLYNFTNLVCPHCFGKCATFLLMCIIFCCTLVQLQKMGMLACNYWLVCISLACIILLMCTISVCLHCFGQRATFFVNVNHFLLYSTKQLKCRYRETGMLARIVLLVCIMLACIILIMCTIFVSLHCFGQRATFFVNVQLQKNGNVSIQLFVSVHFISLYHFTNLVCPHRFGQRATFFVNVHRFLLYSTEQLKCSYRKRGKNSEKFMSKFKILTYLRISFFFAKKSRLGSINFFHL